MTDQDADAEPLGFEPGELPDLGEENRLVLMAVDPYLVFAYWNVTPKRMEAAKALFDDGEFEGHVLRFHDTTGIQFDGVNSRGSFDVNVQLEAGRSYVRLWAPEKSYCADIGLRGKDGRLVALTRSNMVETPPDWPHVRVDESSIMVEQAPPMAGVGTQAVPQGERHAVSHEALLKKAAEIVASLKKAPAPEPAPPVSERNGHSDLAEMSERRFRPGVSSALLGKRD